MRVHKGECSREEGTGTRGVERGCSGERVRGDGMQRVAEVWGDRSTGERIEGELGQQGNNEVRGEEGVRERVQGHRVQWEDRVHHREPVNGDRV